MKCIAATAAFLIVSATAQNDVAGIEFGALGLPQPVYVETPYFDRQNEAEVYPENEGLNLQLGASNSDAPVLTDSDLIQASIKKSFGGEDPAVGSVADPESAKEEMGVEVGNPVFEDRFGEFASEGAERNDGNAEKIISPETEFANAETETVNAESETVNIEAEAVNGEPQFEVAPQNEEIPETSAVKKETEIEAVEFSKNENIAEPESAQPEFSNVESEKEAEDMQSDTSKVEKETESNNVEAQISQVEKETKEESINPENTKLEAESEAGLVQPKNPKDELKMESEDLQPVLPETKTEESDNVQEEVPKVESQTSPGFLQPANTVNTVNAESESAQAPATEILPEYVQSVTDVQVPSDAVSQVNAPVAAHSPKVESNGEAEKESAPQEYHAEAHKGDAKSPEKTAFDQAQELLNSGSDDVFHGATPQQLEKIFSQKFRNFDTYKKKDEA